MSQAIIITGAGLSAESGIPTFRDPGGMWEKFKPEELADISTFDQNRATVFSFYNQRRQELATFSPNLAHTALAQLQREFGSDRLLLLTQNGDDLLERAGATNVVHLHGKMTGMQCRTCAHTWDVGYTAVPTTATCPQCTSPDIKPDLVFFGEAAPLYDKLDSLVRGARRSDLIAVIGTKGAVLPFKRLVGNRHHPQRPYTVLVNLHREHGVAYHKFFDLTLFTPITEVMPSLMAKIRSKLSSPVR